MHYEAGRVFSRSFGRVGKVALVLVVLGLATSCGKKSADEKGSQSIVRVNGDEITVLQLNNELQRSNVQPGLQEEAGKQIVSALVDRQILMQEAYKNKLDRNPRVMQVIENAKSQVLAQAYLEDKVSKLAKPTEAEINDYRAKHPDIFANRKVYIMDEISFKTDEDVARELKPITETAKTLEEVAQWLDARQLKYTRNRMQHAAETVPAPLLEKIAKMAVGDMIFINSKGSTVVARTLEIKEAAISEKDSQPLIERIIFDQKRKQAALEEIKRLRGIAKIEYINKKFAPSTSGSTAESAEPAVIEKPVEPAKPGSSGKVDSHIEKGLSGL